GCARDDHDLLHRSRSSRTVPGRRAGTPDRPPSSERPERSGAAAARNAVCLGDRFRSPHRRPAHAPGFPPGGERAPQHDRVSRMKAALLNDNRGLRTFMLVLGTGDEAMSALAAFAREHTLAATQFTAIGAFSHVVV